MNDYAYKTTAHIHSLKGEMDLSLIHISEPTRH